MKKKQIEFQNYKVIWNKKLIFGQGFQQQMQYLYMQYIFIFIFIRQL